MTGDEGVRAQGPGPDLSVVVLAWNNVELTRRCVASVRAHTSSSYELLVVDNGSDPPGPGVARETADVVVLHATNRGFAAGMNSGLERARGEVVAFVNNDTVLPPDWDRMLVEQARRDTVGIVVPAVTAAGNAVSVRTRPGTTARALPPFREVPSGVVYVMRTQVARALGGWDERYEPAGAEDADLCFQVWLNGLEVVLDERVLVEHVSKASASLLPDQSGAWATNRRRLLRKWREGGSSVVVLPGSDPDDVARRRRQARLVAWSMTVYFATLGALPEGWRRALLPALRRGAGAGAGLLAARPRARRRRQ